MLDSYVLPALTTRRAAGPRPLLAGLDSRHTLEAAERLPASTAGGDRLVGRRPLLHRPTTAERLAELLPQGRLELIEGARTFSPEDQPERVAELVASLSAAGAAR